MKVYIHPAFKLDTINMSPTRRSSRLRKNTGLDSYLPHTDTEQNRRNTRRTTPIVRTLAFTPGYRSNPASITYSDASSSSLRLNGKTLNRARPRRYRAPPPEAYLIIRAHRRQIGGWCEDWSKKGDGWYVPLSQCVFLHEEFQFWRSYVGLSTYLSFRDLFVLSYL